MTSYLLAGPVEEPISLDRARAWLRVEDDAEDGLIAALVTAARIHVETMTGRALMPQTWRVTLDAWPRSRAVRLPVAPLISLETVRIYDAAGSATELATELFQTDGQGVPARLLVPDAVAEGPVPRDRMGIEIDYVAGFGTGTQDVPGDLVHAVLVLVGYWHENRDSVIVSGAGAVAPAGFDRLIAGHRRVRL